MKGWNAWLKVMRVPFPVATVGHNGWCFGSRGDRRFPGGQIPEPHRDHTTGPVATLQPVQIENPLVHPLTWVTYATTRESNE